MTTEEFRIEMKKLGWKDEAIDNMIAIYEKWEKECKENGWEIAPEEKLEYHVHPPVLD